uniref:MSH4 n=1 Tax=Arundo donax TaxID=35708 RepID=A0A0A8ZW22_ARUDO
MLGTSRLLLSASCARNFVWKGLLMRSGKTLVSLRCLLKYCVYWT